MKGPPSVFVYCRRNSMTGLSWMDDNGNRNGEGPSNNNYRRSPKRSRVSTPNLNAPRRQIGTVNTAAVVPRNDAARREIEVPSTEDTDSGSSESSGSSSWSSSSSDSESEAGRDLARDVKGEPGVPEVRIRGPPPSATLTELDVLDCPICAEPLSSPVYQCENGHIACGPCCTRMVNKCSNCRCPIGTIRCRALEKVLESVRVSCKYVSNGCKVMSSYNKKLDHEKACECAPCSCPYPNCDYVSKSKFLFFHFTQVHPSLSRQFSFNSAISISMAPDQMQVFLQERNTNMLFTLNRTIKSRGNLVTVVCAAPASMDGSFLYDLTAVIDKDTSIQMKMRVECMPKMTARACSRKCLLVPRDLTDAREDLRLELFIRKNPAFPG